MNFAECLQDGPFFAIIGGGSVQQEIVQESSDPIMNSPRPSQHGFTLVELLVVISIILLLATFGVTKFIEGKRDAEMVTSQDHLGQILYHLKRFETKKRSLPIKRKDGSYFTGSEFVLAIWDDAILDKTANNAKIFFCPSLAQPPLTEDNLEDMVTAESIHYAGRTQENKDFRIGRSTQGKPSKTIVACNKPLFEGQIPHAGRALAVIYLDGSSGEISREDFGPDWGDDEPLAIGEESPVEALQGLSGAGDDY